MAEMARSNRSDRPAHARPYSSPARAAVRLLGAEIARERKRRRVTAADLAERARISLMTLRKVERGEPSVAIGIVFEVAVLLGIDLLGTPTRSRPGLAAPRSRWLFCPSECGTRERAMPMMTSECGSPWLR